MTRKKGYSTIVCFVLVSIITIILLLNGMIIHAEGLEELENSNNSFSGLYGYDFDVYGLWTIQGYQNSYLYDSDVYLPDSYVTPVTGSLLDTFDLSDYYQDYPYFVFTQDYSNRNVYNLYLFSEPSLFVLYGNHSVAVRGNGDFLLLVLNNSGSYLSLADSFSFSDDMLISGNYTHRFVFSNIDVYGTNTNVSGDDLLSTSDYSNINYCIYDENGDLIYNNPISGGGSDAPPEGSQNNLYMESASWKLMNKYPYGNGTNFTVGNVSFSGQCNDYMIQHPEEFQIVYTFEIDTQLYYRVTQDYSWGVSKVFTASNGVNISNAVAANFSFQSDGFTQSLSDFMSGSYGKVFSLDEIYESADCTTAFNGHLANDFTAKDFNDMLGTAFGNAVIQNISDSNSLNVCQFKYYNVTCNAYIEAINKVSPTSNLHPRSGLATSVFDLVTGHTVRTSDDITYNNNPYYDNDTETDSDIVPTSDIPSSNATGGSATSSSGGNSQIVNVNGNDSAKYLPTLINKLVPDTNGDGGLSESFQNLTNSNGWIQYMSATFYFVPADVWTNLNTYFVAFIGIIGVAFIIRIILDLL